VQFLLILLLLFATGCRPTELVDAKKKKKKKKKKKMRTPGLDDDETCANEMDDKGFDDVKASADADFGFDSDNYHDNAVANFGFKNNDDGFDNDIAISDD
jgi:hypothetical protein